MASYSFIKLGSYTGDALDSAHVGWCEVLDFEFGVSFNADFVTPDDAPSGDATLDNFKFTKRLDKASIDLLTALHAGTKLPTAIFHLCRPTGSQVVILTVTMTNVIIKALDTTFEEDYLSEEIELRYSKIEWSVIPTDSATGAAGSPVRTAWDVELNKSA